MTSKFAIKSILAVSSVFILSAISSTASAVLYPQSTSQTSCTLKMRAAGQCSIVVEGILKGLGNVTQTPTAYRVAILIKEGQLVFQNPAGKSSQANGVPFGNIFVEVASSDLIKPFEVSKNGRALGFIKFSDDELIDAIVAGLQFACGQGDPAACASLEEMQSQIDQHSNWIRWAVITKGDVLGQQWAAESPDCSLSGNFSGCTLEDALGQKCDAPPAVLANPQSFIGQEFDYVCTEACHNKTGAICPTSLPLAP